MLTHQYMNGYICTYEYLCYVYVCEDLYNENTVSTMLSILHSVSLNFTTIFEVGK